MPSHGAQGADQTIEIFDAGEARTDSEWLLLMDEIGLEVGYFERLGARHSAFFSDLGPVLVVSFETLAGIRAAGGGQMPLGYQIAAPRGWSSLSLIAHADTWFRDPAVWGYFDRLIDEGFFEDFDRVVFYGAGMGGYAACAYVVAAPGATVLALAPQASLSPEVAEWDRRYLAARRFDFDGRFGFAPEMAEAAAQVFLIYDPWEQVDAAHAALFRGPQVVKLRARHIGRDPQAELARMGLLRPIIDAACTGTLDARRFYRLWRARRTSTPVLGRMILRLERQNRPKRLLRALHAVLARVDHPRLRAMLSEAEAAVNRAKLEAAEARRSREKLDPPTRRRAALAQ